MSNFDGQPGSDGVGANQPANRFGQGSLPGAGPLVDVPDFSGRSEQAFRPHFASPRVTCLRGGMRVVMSPEAYRTMLLYVELAPLEVGWQGTAVRKGNDFIIDKVYLLRQTVSAATTDISVQGRDELCMELLSQGQAGVEAVNNLRFWGHSHVRMEVEASGRDEMTMREFEEGGLPWAIRGIFNKLGRAKFSLFLYEDGLRVDDVPWVVAEIESSVGSTVGEVAVGRVLLAQGRSYATSRFGSSGLVGDDRGGYGWNGRGRYLGDMGDEPTPNLALRQAPDQPLAAGFSAPESRLPIQRRSPYEGLAPQLIPDDTLRAAVSADYKVKVDERGFRSWWTRLHGDENQGDSPVTASGVATETTVARTKPDSASGDNAELLQSLGIDQIRGGSEVDDRSPLVRTDGGGSSARLSTGGGRKPAAQEEQGVVGTVLGWLGFGGSKTDSGKDRGGRQ